MTLAGPDVVRLLMSLGLLVIAAHAVGHLFVMLRQPRVIGEIMGGLLLGPTVLGVLLPSWHDALFPEAGASAAVLGWSYQLGLLFLMFCSGAEMRTAFRPGEGRVVGLVAAMGVTVPFLAALALFATIQPAGLAGPAANETAVTLVFALAVAVTSIPVISRIMVDLGIIDTSFARVVLGVAVLEDLVVYVVLALVLGMSSAPTDPVFGLPAVLGLEPGSVGSMTFHAAATGVFLTTMALGGASLFTWLRASRWNLVASSSPIAFHLVFLFGATLVSLWLGITPIFGAFMAGIATSSASDAESVQARASIKAFSFAYFVPVYFAIVGAQLDLLHSFQPWFFCWFLVFACVAKTASAYAGARLAAEPRATSRYIALATNARGGPGIVLASVAFGAGIVSEEFYTSLVLLAIVTSVVAGSWLGRLVRSGTTLREEEPAPARRPRTSAHRTSARWVRPRDPSIGRTGGGQFWWRRRWPDDDEVGQGLVLPRERGARCATHRAG
jgi:Kef-type K+ transport system membrane component KefB